MSNLKGRPLKEYEIEKSANWDSVKTFRKGVKHAEIFQEINKILDELNFLVKGH